MKKEYLLVTLFFVIIGGFIYFFYQLVVPFFVPICWAAVIAILLQPVYDWLQKKIHSERAASILLTIVVIIVIIGPVGWLFIALVNEAGDAVQAVNRMYKSGELDKLLSFNLPWLTALKERFSHYYDLSQINIETVIKTAIDKVTGVLFSQTSWLVTNATRAVFYFGLMIFTLYYFLKDGEKIVNRIKRLLPMTESQIETAFGQLHDVIIATLFGGLVIALVQGFLGGVLFAAVGLPSPLFWGAVMAFLSVIPIVGAFLVYIPAGIILILGGSYAAGIVVILVGIIIISQIDNVIRPYLISGRTALHPLLLFFTILGGIALFGLLGIVIGPLVAAIFMTIIHVMDLKLHPDEEPDLPNTE